MWGNRAIRSLFHAVINLFNQACTRTREKLTSFSLASVGNAGLPQLFAGCITQGGGRVESCSIPKATRGNRYIHWDTSAHRDRTQGATASGKIIPSCSRKVALLYRGYINVRKSLLRQERGSVTGQSFHWVIFLRLGFSHFGKKPFLALPGENSQHKAVGVGFF